MLPEVRMARVSDAISSHRAGRLSCVDAIQHVSQIGLWITPVAKYT